MTREDIDFIGAMNMCDEISNEAYKKIMVHCEEEQPCIDAISRQAALDCLTATRLKQFDFILQAREQIMMLPSVSTEKTGRCKDCKYFEYDSVANVDGIPLIVAHEICSRWGDGCKTREDGYCFLFESGAKMVEPQESEDKE